MIFIHLLLEVKLPHEPGLSLHRSVGWLVGWLFCHNFFKFHFKFHFLCSYRSTCYLPWLVVTCIMAIKPVEPPFCRWTVGRTLFILLHWEICKRVSLCVGVIVCLLPCLFDCWLCVCVSIFVVLNVFDLCIFVICAISCLWLLVCVFIFVYCVSTCLYVGCVFVKMCFVYICILCLFVFLWVFYLCIYVYVLVSFRMHMYVINYMS